ncbi:hypothetical protein EDC04DRAFT_1536992 [Pisolithus marmoratus]|nr:hypothetical protein EDC04DRAFT_1536992 [Pisolithus marmoratus]
MHRRHDAQRQDIIDSLDHLIFQLYCVSFFLAPALLPLLCRVFSHYREADSKLSLRAWFILLCLSNLPSFWLHARDGAAEGRAIVLDFVGMGYVPSKLHLLLLDVFIVLLQMVLTTISYEKSLRSSSPSAIANMSLPTPAASTAPLPATSSVEEEMSKYTGHEPMWIVDLRIRHIISHLREPAPSGSETNSMLPLPNTTPLPIPVHLRAIMRRREDGRRRVQTQSDQVNDMAGTRVSTNMPGG